MADKPSAMWILVLDTAANKLLLATFVKTLKTTVFRVFHILLPKGRFYD